MMNREKCEHFSRMEGERVPRSVTEGVSARAASEPGLHRLRSLTLESTVPAENREVFRGV
jgi:hypothetical protein